MIESNTREDGKPAHEWATGKELKFSTSSQLYNVTMCRNCGMLKGNPKYPETPCKGRVKVTLR